MVPVGGSLIYSPKKKQLVDQINKMYPGRASAAPIIDLFVTLLNMGESTFKRLLKERKENFKLLVIGLESIAKKYDERVLATKNNKISIAVTLSNLTDTCLKPRGLSATYFGSYLFSRRVSGVRVVDRNEKEQ
jgi:O-phospho-L-seryl-tRNASec:L-selenocysteinyl-tRNA synthase